MLHGELMSLFNTENGANASLGFPYPQTIILRSVDTPAGCWVAGNQPKMDWLVHARLFSFIEPVPLTELIK